MGRQLFLGPLAAAALLLAACGGDDSSGAATTTAAAVPAAEQAAADTSGATEPAPAIADGKVAAGDSTMLPLQPVEYVYEGDMPALDGSAGSWRWTPGRSPTTDQIATVATALGVTGDVTEQSADMGGGWVVGGDPGLRLSVGQDAQGSWSLIGDTSSVCVDEIVAEPATVDAAPAIDSDLGTVEPDPADPAVAPDEPVAPPETSCVAPVAIPTADEARATAVELLQALGLNPDDYEITADSQEWGAWVDARLLVDGIAAPVLTSFGFGPEGALTYASGQLLAPEPAEQYQRVGTAAAALEQLQADQLRSYNPAVDPAATDVAPLPATDLPARELPAPDLGTAAPAGDGGESTASTAAPDTPVSAPASPTIDASNPIDTAVPADAAPAEPIKVVLTGVEAGWWMVWADDGTIWLIPGYDFITDQDERISAPAVAQIDMPVVETMTGMPQPAIGAGEAPAEPDIASPLGG